MDCSGRGIFIRRRGKKVVDVVQCGRCNGNGILLWSSGFRNPLGTNHKAKVVKP